MKLVLSFVVFLILGYSAQAKIFTRCELAQELKRQGFVDLRNWVCLIEAESGRNTAAVGGPNSNGSYDWGLFQINDRYWCDAGTGAGLSNDCNTSCNNLITDDITIASECSKKIWNRHGWTAWHAWVAKCQNQPLPDLSSCGV